MTKQEMEEEISLHLNAATNKKRKEVEEDIFYVLSMKKGDIKAALQRVHEIIYGSARNRTESRRLRKKKRKEEWLGEFV